MGDGRSVVGGLWSVGAVSGDGRWGRSVGGRSVVGGCGLWGQLVGTVCGDGRWGGRWGQVCGCS